MSKIFNSLAKEAMLAAKNGEKEKQNALKNLKAKMLEWKTSKEGAVIVNANNGEIPDAQELVIIKKYVKELLNDVATYATIKPEAAQEAQREADIISVYLPAEASESDIKNTVEKWLNDNNMQSLEKRQMGIVIKYVKEQLENADGSLVAKIVNSYVK